MSDFTQTPNLGLYKPTYNADAEQWGNHLNTNADKLDAAISSIPGGSTGGFLPTAGGTMIGPLNYTPTGATTSRSAQARAVDVANVLDFGADPTATTGSTTAIRNAIATGKAVYLPTGNYVVTDILTLGSGQLMYGDGRVASQIYVYAAGGGNPSALFNMAALGVVQLAPVETSSSIRDIGIVFAQGDTSVRANLAPFPPAIFAVNSPRFSITRVRITAANVGINATGNSGGSFITDLEFSAFTCGLMMDGSFDNIHCKAMHFWNFGINVLGGSGLAAIFQDGNTLAIQAGRVDGLNLVDVFCMFGSVVFTANDISGGTIVNLALDRLSRLTFNGTGTHQIGQLTITNAGPNPSTNQSLLSVAGGRVIIDNAVLSAGAYQTVDAIQTSGSGELVINGGALVLNATGVSMAHAAGAHTRIKNTRFLPGGGPQTVPFINQTAGDLTVSNCEFGSVGSGVGIAVNVDSATNRVTNNIMGGFTATFPTTDPVLGQYSQPDGPSIQQLTLGAFGPGRSGRLNFRRASDGAYRGWVGITDDSTAVSLVHTATTNPKVSLNTVGNNGVLSFQIGGTEYANVTLNGISLSRITAAPVATGPALGRLALIGGTTAGTAKLVAYAGTSLTPTTIVDNIGAGF